MTAIDVEVTPVGATDLAAVLDGWAKRALTLAEAYAAIAADFHVTEARRFGAEGPGWRPLADATKRDRERRGYGPGPILVRTDTLALSLTRPDAEGSVYRVEPDGFFVGTNVPYAHWHQTGADDRPPQRKVVDLDTADEVRWLAILGTYLAHGTVGAAEVVVSSHLGPGGPPITGP